ncbi:MAG: fatty acid desaturase [Hyphomicrobium sp.]
MTPEQTEQTMTISPRDATTFDDYSNTFIRLRRTLVSRDGRPYLDFVRGLKPDFAKVRRDLAIGYGMLAATVITVIGLLQFGIQPVASTLVAAALIGYWIAYIQCFLHEGAHYNLAAVRDDSDRLCNVAIGWLVGTSVQDYRVVHFQHHRALGTTDDSEFTYFFPLNLVFFVKTLLGVRVLEVLLARAKFRSGSTKTDDLKPVATATEKPAAVAKPGAHVVRAGIAAHVFIVATLAYAGGWLAALAWILGVAMFFPFFGALRQLLEHRDDMASSKIDYTRTNHGAYTRMFGSDPLSASFGAAGFNRHLLHHWEPQVSYTNLDSLEDFLLQTDAREIIETRRSSYAATALRLISIS